MVRNPFLVPWDSPPPWPESDGSYHLACVGRLYPKEKGQDILLRVLAGEKWRGRPLKFTFFGAGEQRAGLEAMAASPACPTSASPAMRTILPDSGARHHALVLPSRAEGLPLVVVEAMLCGRVPIVTDVAGNAELVEDGESGFVAEAAAEKSFDSALERAWARRDEWPAIGAAAAVRARALVPPDPPATLADALLRLVEERRPEG